MSEVLPSKDESQAEPTRYSRPEGVMGGPCLHCQASQPEHRGLTCDEVREHRRKAIRRTFAQAHANATLETIKQHLETMIHSAEVYVDAEDVITAYKIKTGALHKLIGHLGLTIPVNHPVVGASETTDARDAARYRLIRDVTCVFGGEFRQFPLDRHQLADGPHISGGHRLEAAIDALLAERAAEKTSGESS